jgi:hypothetical protein
MGTGGLSIVLHQLPYTVRFFLAPPVYLRALTHHTQFHGLGDISIVFFGRLLSSCSVAS